MKEFLQAWLDIFYTAFENRLHNGIDQESTDPRLIHQHRAEKSEAYQAYQQIRQLKDEKPKVTRKNIFDFHNNLTTIVEDSENAQECYDREIDYIYYWLKSKEVEVEK